MADREENLYRAQLAEQAGRYDDMVEIVKKLPSRDVELTEEERTTLTTAFHNAIETRRGAWMSIASMENEHEEWMTAMSEREPLFNTPRTTRTLTCLKQYRNQVEKEIRDLCHDMLELIDKMLLPSATSGESRVYYYKIKGDYHRYLAEFSASNEHKEAAESSLTAYKAASDIAMQELSPTNSLRLGLALNFAVFFAEIFNSPDRASRLARAAFNDALVELESLDEESYYQAMSVLDVLHENITMWSQDQARDDASEGSGGSEELQNIDYGDHEYEYGEQNPEEEEYEYENA